MTLPSLLVPLSGRELVRVFLLFTYIGSAVPGKYRREREDDLVVRTDKGKVRGKRYFIPDHNKIVDAYLGIPFAQPPVGSLRFKHPLPIDEWQGTLNATHLSNSCYQNNDEEFGPTFWGSNMWNSPTPVSEDCLYLNVWVPKIHPPLKKAAVLVWIFGGGFYYGSPTLALYDGKYLAAEEEIIVVSINYRVGPFGFLTLNEPDAPGNAGMFDQLMGMEWVQRNIKYFGGDPYNVTLFGESAGAVSVSLHMLSPLSRPLFQRVILQSGAPTVPWGVYTKDEGKRRALIFAHRVGCPETGNIDVTIACLRTASADKLSNNQWVVEGPTQFPFIPVVDGCFLVEAPELSLRRNNFKKCPVLLGSNLNEGAFFVIYHLDDFMNLTHTSMNREQFLTSINALFYYYPQYPQNINPIALDAIAYQYSNWLDPDDKHANLRSLDDALGESMFLCHVNHLANTYAKAGQDVYYYYFTQRFQSNPWPAWMGVLHADEIIFAFGTPLKKEVEFTESEKELSRKIMSYWANFAKYSDPNIEPNGESLKEWPLHTPHGKEYLELHSRFLHETDKSKAIGRGPRVKQCAFWMEYLPDLIAATADITDAEKEWKLQFKEWSTKYIVDWKLQYDKYLNQGTNCPSHRYDRNDESTTTSHGGK